MISSWRNGKILNLSKLTNLYKVTPSQDIKEREGDFMQVNLKNFEIKENA